MVIAFSGSDGAGKTCQIDLLAAWLESKGLKVRRTWYRPGYSGAADAGRRLIRRLFPGALPSPGPSERRARAFRSGFVSWAWLLFAQIDALLFFGLTLRWHQSRADAVLCDRYVFDGELCLADRFPGSSANSWLWRLVRAAAPEPSLWLLLWVRPDTAAQRLEKKAEPFPDDPRTREFRHARYEQLKNARACLVVDAERSADIVFDSILQHVAKLPAVRRSPNA